MRRHGWIGIAAFLAWSSRAHAGSEADHLFTEGKAALEAKRYDEACTKLARSQELDPATGTLLALALCHEGQGKTATAWREFSSVAAASARSGRNDRVELARAKIAALEPKLARVTIAVSVSEVSVRFDSTPVASDELNRPYPIDPGEHDVTVTAAGKKPWTTRVHASASNTTTVTVPALEDETVARVEVPATPERASTLRLVGWSLVVGGAASFVVGTIFGVRALVLQDYAKSRCPSSPCSDPVGVGENHDAQTSAWVADFGIGLGVAAAAAGVVLVVMVPRARHAAFRVAPLVGHDVAGAALFGGW